MGGGDGERERAGRDHAHARARPLRVQCNHLGRAETCSGRLGRCRWHFCQQCHIQQLLRRRRHGGLRDLQMHWIFKFPLAERANLVLVSVGPVPLLFIHLRKRDCVDFNCGAVHKIAKSTNESRQKGEKDIAACLHSHACTIGPVPNWAKIKLPNQYHRHRSGAVASPLDCLAWVPLHANRRRAGD